MVVVMYVVTVLLTMMITGEDLPNDDQVNDRDAEAIMLMEVLVVVTVMVEAGCSGNFSGFSGSCDYEVGGGGDGSMAVYIVVVVMMMILRWWRERRGYWHYQVLWRMNEWQ